MKKLYALCYGVILLCIVGTAILLIFTPDTIPVHYNFAGEVDRFGSKYENLIWPIFTIIMGAFFILLAKQQRKKGETVNEKILLYTGICTLLFFAALGFYFMLKAIRYDPDAAATVSIDAMKFTGIAIGILLVILGNIMPKMRRNAMFGLRTKWSMANDSVWQKSQRFGGIASVLCGLAMIVISAFVPGVWNLLVMTFELKDGIYWYSKAGSITTITMDENAQALICGLPAAKYKLVETVVPNGFFPAPAQDFTIQLTDTYEKPLEITVTNTPRSQAGA